MWNGKFKVVAYINEAKYSDIKVGETYSVVNGFVNYGSKMNGYYCHNSFKELQEFWEDDLILELVEEFKMLSNSALWKLVEDNLISDGSLFQLQEDCDDKSIAIFSDDDGEFFWYSEDECSGNIVEFNRNDKWIQLPSKPRMSRVDAEREFGIIITG